MKRLPAEWEKQKFVQMVFPDAMMDWEYCLEDVQKTFVNIIDAIAKYEPCHVVCSSLELSEKFLSHANQNVKIILSRNNDTWIRDFGGITIEENGAGKTLDFTFNGWGLKFASNYDNRLTRELCAAGLLPYPVQTVGLVFEGGSVDSNGAGTLLVTTQCLLEANRNPHLSKEEIDAKLKELFGAKKIIWLDYGYLAGDDTDSHVDTLARFLDEKTIAYVKCYNENDEHFEELLKMEEELKNTGFSLVPLPLPAPKYLDGQRLPATYANFLFVNGALLVPTYRDENDEIALQTLREFYGDKLEVVGVDCLSLVNEHGSLHCSTMQFPDLAVSK